MSKNTSRLKSVAMRLAPHHMTMFDDICLHRRVLSRTAVMRRLIEEEFLRLQEDRAHRTAEELRKLQALSVTQIPDELDQKSNEKDDGDDGDDNDEQRYGT